MNASDGETRSKSSRVDIVVDVGATVVVVAVVDGGGGAVVLTTGSVAEQAAATRLRSVSANALRTARQSSRTRVVPSGSGAARGRGLGSPGPVDDAASSTGGGLLPPAAYADTAAALSWDSNCATEGSPWAAQVPSAPALAPTIWSAGPPSRRTVHSSGRARSVAPPPMT